jgi:regulator of sirC expression with transglutaminase-like and TPR domain
MYALYLVLFLILSFYQLGVEARGEKKEIATPLKSLYSTLDPLSVTEHLAFYELYPDTKEGQNALKRAWQLLSSGEIALDENNPTLPAFDIQSIISLITRQQSDAKVTLTPEQLNLIEKISSRLHNRKLKGHSAWKREEILALSPEETDLSRGLLLFQFDERAEVQDEIKHYEAILDIMALQIAARLSPHPTDEEKIEAINHFIFHEMRFRFPPHSLYAKDIDLYTFLPSVLDNRQGVCLGVSILYLCIAQRLDLPLEIITPPGHIYIRYGKNHPVINIETTARGINPPSEIYLGINTRHLQQRTIKEVIGLSFMNQASVFWSKEDYETTTKLYEKAMPFLASDPLLKMLLGYNYLFLGRKNEGVQLLREIKNVTFDEAVSPESIPEDYLLGKIDEEGIKAVFLPVDETRASVLEKQKELQKILKRYPYYRAGLMHLATTYLQLGRGNEAKETLERYHKIDPHNSTIEYYLCILSLERLDYNRAWSYLKKTEKLVYARSHYPKALEALRTQLRRACPEPT